MKKHISKPWLIVKRQGRYAVTTRAAFYDYWQGCGFLAFSAHYSEADARRAAHALTSS